MTTILKSTAIAIVLSISVAAVGCTPSSTFSPNFLGNSSEVAYCVIPSHLALCAIARGASDEAKSQQMKYYGPQNMDGNKPNTFLHSTWHALMTKRMSNNPGTAIGFGIRHEALAPQIPDAIMDYHNNEVGALVGAQAANEDLAIRFNKGLADSAAFAGGTNPPTGPGQALWYIRG